MYVFTGAGSRENVITTGKISIDYLESNKINLTNQYPMNDTLGIAQTGTNNQMEFTITSNTAAGQTLNYAIALDAITEGATLKENYVKVYLLKGSTVVSGFSVGEGQTIGSLKKYHIKNLIDNYVMYTDSLEGTASQTYTLKAWVADNYDLPTTDTSNGDIKSNTTTSETFSFKIKVVGTDNDMLVTTDSTAPTIADIIVEKYDTTWNTLADNSLLKADDQLRITTVYSEAVTGTSPTLALKFGDTIGAGTIGVGNVETDRISYTYTVQSADLGALNLTFTGNSLMDGANNNANYTLSTTILNYVSSLMKINEEVNYTYSASDEYYVYDVLKSGYYYVELTGAAGQQPPGNSAGGNGGKTTGYIYLTQGEKYYIYVGAMGDASINSSDCLYSNGGYNGGGDGGKGCVSYYQGGAGGGATDIRYFGTYTPTSLDLVSDSSLGLNARIMVAGGGGGGAAGTVGGGIGGAGGGLNGVKAADYSATVLSGGYGGTQVTGGAKGSYTSFSSPTAGSFGFGGIGGYGQPTSTTAAGAGGGGAGYYGGGGGSQWHGGGGGGSSYISGYLGCVAIANSDLTNNPRTARNDTNGSVCNSTSATNDVTCSYHYSNKKFINGTMTSGSNASNGTASIKYFAAGLGPSCQWSSPTSSYIKSGSTTTYSLTCTDENHITTTAADVQNALTTTAGSSINSVTRSGSDTNYVYTVVLTATTAGLKTITLPAGVVANSENNYNLATTSSSIRNIVISCTTGTNTVVSGNSSNQSYFGNTSCNTSVNASTGAITVSMGLTYYSYTANCNYNAVDYVCLSPSVGGNNTGCGASACTSSSYQVSSGEYYLAAYTQYTSSASWTIPYSATSLALCFWHNNSDCEYSTTSSRTTYRLTIS